MNLQNLRIVSSLGSDAAEGGWTFMETLIVMGIILILTASVGFMAIRYLDKAKVASARSQVETLSLAIQAYALDCGTVPTRDQGLDALWTSTDTGTGAWSGPYLNQKPGVDPWGNPFDYIVPGENGLPFGLRSWGADGKTGGSGNDADICSWEK